MSTQEMKPSASNKGGKPTLWLNSVVRIEAAIFYRASRQRS